MKKITILVIISFTAISIFAQNGNMPNTPPPPPPPMPMSVPNAMMPGISTTTPVSNLPETLSATETEFNFGKIPQGKPVTHVFQVTNIGKDSLLINNVQASCGCTTPVWERNKKIAPGASAPITVGYNAAAEGLFTKTVTISYNGALAKLIVIKGEVWKTPVASAPENKGINDLKN